MQQQKLKMSDLYEKYRIESEIGRGASGVCYRVQNIKTKEVLAMKKIHISSMKKLNAKEASSQVSILSRINHPHIIKLLQVFNDQNHLYIIMQYAPKGDLHHILKRRKIKKEFYCQKNIWEMIHSLLTALEYLHSQSIIHRDVKTLNIFVGAHGQLYLGDLGVSKILKTDSGLYSRVGTPLYLAPEIIKYEKYDYKADIWGLGCVCYQLAGLTHPFEGKNIITLGQNIVSAQPKHLENYSCELNSLLMDMLQKNPSKRLSATELLHKYLKEGIASNLISRSQERVFEQPKCQQKRDRKERASTFLKSNQIRRKVINNFLDDKLFFHEKDIIPQEDTPRDNSLKKSVRPIKEKTTERSLEDTILFTRKAKNGEQNKKYVEATHKTYLAINSVDHRHKQIQKQPLPVQGNHHHDSHTNSMQLVKATPQGMFSNGSQKKMPIINYSLPNSKSSNRHLYAPCINGIERKQETKKGDLSCNDINKLPSDNHLNSNKVQRIRPKSSIMTKERHEYTMKNIKKSVKRIEKEDFGWCVETQVLKKPEMIIL